MKVESVIIKKLYGHLDFNIKFFPDMNFLTGINGSGKTSILNVLAWVLGPSLMRLAQLEFSSIKVVCRDSKKGQETINVKKRRNNVEIAIEGEPKSLRVPIFEFPTEATTFERTAPTIPEMYERFTIENKENPVIATLGNLAGPLYLPLDRRWEAAPIARSAGISARYRRLRRPVGEPVGSVLYLAERYYRERQSEVNVLSDELRQELVTYTFGEVVTIPNIRKARVSWTVEEVGKRRETIVRGLNQAGINVPEGIVTKYFKGLEKIVKALEKKGFDRQEPSSEYFEWAINMPQVEKIERLIVRIENYNKRRENMVKRIDAFLETVNSFFCDTNKYIRFDTSGEISVRIGDKHEIRAGSLSSGESQLLILFTYLYFGFEPRQEFVVMIDEPELSLHLKWQNQYVQSVIKANPNAQFILATHAPEIAQKYEENCIELSPKG